MRKVIAPLILTVILIAAALFPGCALTGSSVVTEEKDFTGFTDIDVGSIFEVDITRSDSFSINISADESLLDYVDVSQVGGRLSISLQPRQVFTDFTLQARTLKAEITMPLLLGLNLSGASTGTVSGFKSANDFNLDISGASSLKMTDIEVGAAELAISGTGKISGDMKARDTKLAVSGASQVELVGSANTAVLNASGASKIDLTNFTLGYASISLSGASEATVNVKERVDIVVSDASRLYFLGNPTMGNISVTGASTVKHK